MERTTSLVYLTYHTIKNMAPYEERNIQFSIYLSGMLLLLPGNTQITKF